MRAILPRSMASWKRVRLARAAVSWAAAALLALMIRPISLFTRRLMRIWLALSQATSPETMEISPLMRASDCLMEEVREVILTVICLRAKDTAAVAWARTARMFLTVLE